MMPSAFKNGLERLLCVASGLVLWLTGLSVWGCTAGPCFISTGAESFEKTVFDCVFNLVGVLHKDKNEKQGVTIGEVGLYYANEVEDMIVEMNRALRGSMAITLMLGIEERLFAYAQHPNVDFKKAKVEKFKWRNGFFYSISQNCKGVVVNGVKLDFPEPLPMHTEYLEYAKELGLVEEELKPYNPLAATFEGN